MGYITSTRELPLVLEVGAGIVASDGGYAGKKDSPSPATQTHHMEFIQRT